LVPRSALGASAARPYRDQIPINRIYAVFLFIGEQHALVVYIRPDQGIAAHDVVFQLRQDMLLGRQLRFLAFQCLEVKAHHGDFDGLRVNSPENYVAGV
jgi:hypothetical protein